jgi:hypothetical protein
MLEIVLSPFTMPLQALICKSMRKYMVSDWENFGNAPLARICRTVEPEP